MLEEQDLSGQPFWHLAFTCASFRGFFFFQKAEYWQCEFVPHYGVGAFYRERAEKGLKGLHLFMTQPFPEPSVTLPIKFSSLARIHW